MGLLPVHTVFTTEKVRTRVTETVRELEGLFAPLSGAYVSGYEIHMGQTTPEPNVSAAVALLSGTCDGARVRGGFRQLSARPL
jgi:adenosylcobyric acid synthase